ncbi:MAG: hypothetical protein HW416_2799 [Chloroflexi bacterium]|nr:hypothetical protein [Chloroflexota bacterium]
MSWRSSGANHITQSNFVRDECWTWASRLECATIRSLRPNTNASTGVTTLDHLDPKFLTAEQWALLNLALGRLALFTGLAANAGLSFLLGHGVIPSLVANDVVPPEISSFRWILYTVSAASLVLTLYNLSRIIPIIVTVLQDFYPRFAI